MVSESNYLLALDAGNTRIKWGIALEHGWIARDALPTARAADLAEALEAAPRARHAIASNVAGPALQAELELACQAIGVSLRVIRSEAEQLGVTNGYREPTQLGSDRWAALIAAHRAHGGHKLVVNAGTALTVDALTADGRFVGGIIVPGPGLMRTSLNRGTAGLRLTEGAFHFLPLTTPDAITSGAIQAAVGAVARMHDAMAGAGATPPLVVLSGGAAAEIAPHLPLEVVIHENLVLDGLVLIGRQA
ncbi:MAG: type III pantothenate kinase [Usitatibacter sp.]